MLTVSMPLISITAIATELPVNITEESRYGRLPMYIMENGGNLEYVDVLIKGDRLYAKASSFADKFDYIAGETENSVQLLQTANEPGEEYRWTLISNFTINDTDVWISDGREVTHYYAPYKTIKNDDGIWIPLQFALKIMGREVIVNNGVMVSKPHETMTNIVNNVRNSDAYLFTNMINANRAMNVSGEPGKDALLAEAVSAEHTRNNWLFDAVTVKTGMPSGNTDGIDELASYLVSNLGPENKATYALYYEAMTMYLGPQMLYGGGEVLTNAAENAINQDELGLLVDAMVGKNVIESSAKAVTDQNSSNLKYNKSFTKTYEDLTSYNPIDKTWGNPTAYKEFVDTMNVYKGDPDAKVFKSVEFFGSFLGPLGDFSPIFANVYATKRCLDNSMAENDYSSKIFDKYLSVGDTSYVNGQLVSSLHDRIGNYGEYQEGLIRQYAEDTTESMINGGIEGLITDEIPILKLFFTGKSCKEYFDDMEEITSNQLSSNYSNYIYAHNLASAIKGYMYNNPSVEWAYIYYRSSYMANYYYLKALSNPKAIEYMDEESIIETAICLQTQMEEETYHMAMIRTGFEYGLDVADNGAYNEDYDDSYLVPFVEDMNNSKGNSNANINACGFATQTENYKFYVNSLKDYAVTMEDRDGNKTQVTDGWAHWLNAYVEDENEYLFYIDSSRNVKVYSVSDGTKETVASGNFSRLMVAYGNLFVVEDASLYKIPMFDVETYGEKTMVVADPGVCIAYESDGIYYCDLAGEVWHCNFDGENKESLGIYSSSFDIKNGNIYYSNNNDNKRIYMYNLMTGLNTKLSDVEDTYCINCNNGMIYCKVDNEDSSAFVYTVIPFVNKEIPRVFTWQGKDDELGIKMESLDKSIGRTDRRLFNISNGKIYNEGYTYLLVDIPEMGVNWKMGAGFVLYKLSDIIHEQVAKLNS